MNDMGVCLTNGISLVSAYKTWVLDIPKKAISTFFLRIRDLVIVYGTEETTGKWVIQWVNEDAPFIAASL